MNIKKLFLIILFVFFSALLSFSDDNITIPHNNKSFSKSKKLMQQVYYDYQYSFYCNCEFSYELVDKSIKALVNQSGHYQRDCAKR